MAPFSSVVFFVALALFTLIEGHGRWKCPLPRDTKNITTGEHIPFSNTGNKYGPCGPYSGSDYWGVGGVTKLAPGWNTLIWEESISHTGSPFRVALLDNTETARLILLDHIPHNEASNPIPGLEGTYTPYLISVYIPDVLCQQCSLQLLYVMTDKTVRCNTPVCWYNPEDSACKGSTDPNAPTCAGAPNSNVCLFAGECFSSYHSCTDVMITGGKPISLFPFNSQPSSWPFSTKPLSVYGAEIGTWSADGWLTNVPASFTTNYHNLPCLPQ